MDLTYAGVQIENPFNGRSLATKTLVDTGTVFFSVPEHIAVQLGFDLTEVATREVVLVNGHQEAMPMIGPVRVRFADRFCDLSALVLGDEPLFGAVPMEMMDLVLHPTTQTLSINPSSPYVPTALAK